MSSAIVVNSTFNIAFLRHRIELFTFNPKTAEKHKRDARKEDYDKPSQSGKQSIQD